MAQRISLNTGWLFHPGDAAGADYMGYDDRAWLRVTLPHDWAVSQPFSRSHSSGTGYLPGGVGVYRKHFELPEDIAGKKVAVTFGGVYNHARVWINSNYLGERPYGYSTFTYDISAFIRPGENVFTVRVDHAEVADSRWYTGSGIYRGVTLSVGNRISFDENGIFVSTKAILPDGGAVLRVRFTAPLAEAARFSVAGQTVVSDTGEAVLTLPQAKLWSPEAPYLYTLKCEALRGGEVTDTEEIRFGVRTAAFDPDNGFFLNGNSMKLRGVCVHHDAGALGAAVPAPVWRRRLKKLKAMGCNALRTAHNPPDPALLDLCDELGFLVMDEAFDEWEGAKNKWWQGHNVYPPKRFGYAMDFPQCHTADLSAMVLRDRNHPSVILWSIGNEIDYPNDPYVTPLFKEALGNNDNGKPAAERKYDDKKPDASRLAVISKKLVQTVHALDDTRPVLSALSFPELSTRTGFADTLDVWGYNYREGFYDADHARFPQKVIFGSENGHDPKGWYAVLQRDFIAGQFLWTGIDFLGECRGWPSRISGAGALDLCGYEKPLYYQRKALWTDAPFIKIALAQGDPARGVWGEAFAYTGEPGSPVTAACYTNGPWAELKLNGVSLGRKERAEADGCRLTWEFPYAPGTLTAETEGACDRLCTPGAAEKIVLCPDKSVLPASGEAVAQIEVSLTDALGNLAAADDREVVYQLLGDGEILGIENGKHDDLTPYAARYRRTYRGRAIVYLRAGTVPGDLILYAYTKEGLSARCTLTVTADA